ncbi:MAG: nucleotidyl transferase AbiEii/AbiGii toxin family protein [Candidatus Aminicenantes bacterium]|nr:nucleotidyl transferase AbiEii/AbiGii toxin family protein [Candidatus Aminicenantes bacterium]
MLYREVINEKVFELILSLQEDSVLQEFFLVGGTGLALQIGHRKSNDIDMFTIKDFDQERVLERVEQEFNFRLDYSEKNTLKGFIGDVKVDFLSHKYRLIDPVQVIEQIRLASVHDISAMKINAISNDGTRVKDFIDLYFLLQDYRLDRLLENYSFKYEMRNPLHALKSLNYFEDADLGGWPELVREKEITWEQIKQTIDNACIQYVQSLKQR